nr:MAG TPA: hypothetical protein [Caudoviricetes sp.]
MAFGKGPPPAPPCRGPEPIDSNWIAPSALVSQYAIHCAKLVMFGLQTWKESFTIQVLVFRKQQELSLLYKKPLAVKGMFLTITNDVDIHSLRAKGMICTTETNFKYPHSKPFVALSFNTAQNLQG